MRGFDVRILFRERDRGRDAIRVFEFPMELHFDIRANLARNRHDRWRNMSHAVEGEQVAVPLSRFVDLSLPVSLGTEPS